MGTVVLGKLESGSICKGQQLVMMPNKVWIRHLEKFCSENSLVFKYINYFKSENFLLFN